jgi:hypothetical protein
VVGVLRSLSTFPRFDRRVLGLLEFLVGDVFFHQLLLFLFLVVPVVPLTRVLLVPLATFVIIMA